MLAAIAMKFQAVKLCYQEPTRHYHGPNYVRSVMDTLAPVEDQIKNIPAIELALLWGKSVLSPIDPVKTAKSSSIKLATDLVGLACPMLLKRAQLLIAFAADNEMASSNGPPIDGDARLMVDATLAIFGSNPMIFAQYEVGVRAECVQYITAQQYQKVRLAVIRRHLKKDSIFLTDHFKEQYEHQAQVNLTNLEATLVRDITIAHASRSESNANDY